MDETKYNFKVAQKAEIKIGDKYLIVKRSPNSPIYPGCWDFAGGKLEHGESSKDGLKREVREETTLNVEPLCPKFVFSDKPKNHHALIIVWECNLIGGEVKLSYEHTEYKWATKKELSKLKTEKFLKEYFK